MPTRRQLIQKITLNANASSVTFSNIPQNYTDLSFVVSGRSSRASVASDLLVSFNGSTSNFTGRSLYGDGASAASNTAAARFFGVICGANATANTFGNSKVYIPNYNSSQNKSYIQSGSQENSATTAYISMVSGLWSDTSAISSITLTDSSGANLLAGSTFYLYGITHVPIIRGGEVSIANGYKIHTFKSSGSLQVIEGGAVEYLVVGGGAGGGKAIGGGGGGGGMLYGNIFLRNNSYNVQVGAGGTGGVSVITGTNGSDSSISSILSYGGGGGGGYNIAGVTGGSGGGAGGDILAAGGSSISGQGNNGGANGAASPRRAGGGGGKGSAGVSGSSTGNGGSGEANSITGSSVVYAAGGGGGAYTGISAGVGTTGVSGNGNNVTSGAGGNGTANTGGGGGGGAGSGSGDGNGGNGGSGIVVIRYPYDGN